MSRRDLIKNLIAGEDVERTGFWLGNPHDDMWPILHAHFGTSTEEELRQKLGDDVRWICPQMYDDVYRDPSGRCDLFGTGVEGGKHASRGPLADAETPADLEAYSWPNAEYLNFDACLEDLRNAGDVYRLSGFWTCFYHNIMDLLGMEEYMAKMYTNPDVVRAITDRVCGFYYEANERFFEAAGSLVDGFFFGNDFGTQVSLICGPDQFDEFIMPWFRTFTQQGHKHGYQVVLHSCGAIHEVIERLIRAGVDCLHPLQARAACMDAETLARDYKGNIAFMGGIDTQDLLTNGTPDEVCADVRRVKELLGPHVIISPSHEALLPNVPPANVAAMAEAAVGDLGCGLDP
jgi:uroporphyrinogen decarboxylase